MSGHVLKTLPASRPATIAPLAILKPRRWIIIKASRRTPFIYLKFDLVQAFSAGPCNRVIEFQKSREKIIIAMFKCTNSLYTETLGDMW